MISTVLEIVGYAAFVAGLTLVSVPLALIVGGLVLSVAGIAMGQLKR